MTLSSNRWRAFRSAVAAVLPAGSLYSAGATAWALASRDLLLRSRNERTLLNALPCEPIVPDLRWLDELAAACPDPPLDDADIPEPDLLRRIQECLIPAAERRRQGAFLTPSWLAEYIVRRESTLVSRNACWLDPTAGAGAFLAAWARLKPTPAGNFVGIESCPLAWLAATAQAALLGQRATVYCADALADPPPAAQQADIVVGNPPWLSWERVLPAVRAQSDRWWRHYGFHTQRGMAGILGGTKRDLAMLFVYRAADVFLRPGGRLAMILPRAVLRSIGAGRGFRRWQLPDGTSLQVQAVEDLGSQRSFPGMSQPAVILTLSKGSATEYPVPYTIWLPHGRQQVGSASPSASDPLGPWTIHPCTGKKSAVVDRVLGPCEYDAHLGVNTGGANGVYWLERLGEEPEDAATWLVANRTDRGRRQLLRQVLLLEARFIHPLLIGKDVQQWRATPSGWLLFVQDPDRRRGIDVDRLNRDGPLSFAYLSGQRQLLAARAAYKRYYQRPAADNQIRSTGEFYSLFDVGRYTVAPWKVVWNRMGTKLAAAVVGCLADKPILPQETHGLIAVSSETEAYYLAALLNSPWAQATLEATSPVGGKSFATPSAVTRLRLGRFDPRLPLHLRLAVAGQQMASNPTTAGMRELKLASAAYWEIVVSESGDAGGGSWEGWSARATS